MGNGWTHCGAMWAGCPFIDSSPGDHRQGGVLLTVSKQHGALQWPAVDLALRLRPPLGSVICAILWRYFSEKHELLKREWTQTTLQCQWTDGAAFFPAEKGTLVQERRFAEKLKWVHPGAPYLAYRNAAFQCANGCISHVGSAGTLDLFALCMSSQPKRIGRPNQVKGGAKHKRGHE